MTGAEELSARPDAPVLVVHARNDISDDWLAEHVDAARRAFPGMCVMPLHGLGIDVSALTGRDVVIWPWMGSADARAALRPAAGVLARTAKRVRLIAPKAEDACGPGGLNGHDPIAWARACAEEVRATAAVDLETEWFGAEEPVPDGHVLADVQIEDTHERVSDWTPPGSHPDMIEEPWPEPVDLFTKLPVPQLRPEHLPPEVARFVFDQSEIIGNDPGTMALAVLTACAAATHDSIKIRPRRHDRWTEEARLWAGIVGDPGVKKTPPIKRALAPIRALEIDWAKDHKLELPAYQIALKRYAKAEAIAVNDPNADVPDLPEKPALHQLIAQDTTIEALAMALTDNPGGMLCFHDELSGFFGSMDAYRANGGKDKAFYLQAYGGGAYNVNRVGRGVVPVPNLSLCLLGGIQPEPMRKISAKLDDDGLLQRFMLVMAQDPDREAQDRPDDRQAVYGYRGVIEQLVRMRGETDSPVTLSDGAHAVRERVDAKVRKLAKTEVLHGRMRSHLRKWEGLFPRLCLVYHAIACAELVIDPASVPVSDDIASRVALFLFEYLLGHMRAFYEDVLGQSGSLGHAQWIAGHILAHAPESISNRDIYKAYRPWRGMADHEKGAVMATLELSGWVRSSGRGRPGLPETRWFVNPSLQKIYAERAATEKESRASMVKMISKLNGS